MLDGALGVQALVVAGHDAVEHRAFGLSRGAGVVVDDVHAHSQAGAMQGHHHLAKFAHANRAIRGVAGKAAFGRIEVIGVIAPVETVVRGARHHRRLLLFAIRPAAGHRRDAAGFGHRGEVENRQQVHIGHAGVGQRLQVLHAARAGIGKGEVFAAMCGRNRVVVDREVAHVQLVDHHVGLRGDPAGAFAASQPGGLSAGSESAM